jgi:transposase
MILTTPIMTRRTPLAPLDLNRIRNQELSPWLRGSIQTWAAVGLGNTEIAQKTFLTPATVQSTLRRNSQRHEGTTLSRSGRPSKLSRRDRRALLRYVRKNPKVSYEQVLADTGLPISKKTAYRILREEGIKKWIAKQRPLLTEESAKIRLEWCLARKDWTWEQWKTYIFSDEASIERGKGGRQWVFQTPHQK